MSTERALLKGAVIPTIFVGAIAVGLSTWFLGRAGFIGATLAQFIVVAFFASNLAAARISRDLDPSITMAIAMVSYLVKVILLGVFLGLITTFVPEEICHRGAFGLSAVAATFAWLGGEIVAFLRLKTHLQLPPTQG
jgi:ATP synthase protein I